MELVGGDGGGGVGGSGSGSCCGEAIYQRGLK